jgi:N-acetylneuraminic acid mutarotase
VFARPTVCLAVLAVLASGCGDDGGGGGGGAADAAADPADAPPGFEGWRTETAVLGGPLQETAVVELGGLVYVLGGFQGFDITDQVLVFDPATGDWSQASPMPEPVHHANAAVVGGKIYVVGAMQLDGLSFTAIGATWQYDPVADDWTVLQSMPAGTERGASFVGAVDGVIYVAGGLVGSTSVDLTSGYVVGEDRWIGPLAPLPAARDHGAAAAAGGLLYAAGGRTDGVLTGRVDRYDPGEDGWTTGAPMITARAGTAAAVVGGELYVVGGENLDAPQPGVFAEVESYDLAGDRWSSHGEMLTPRHGMGAASVGGTIYVPGGATTKGFGATDIHESYTP